MIGDADQDVPEIGFRIEAVELCSLDQRQDRSSAFAAFVLADEWENPDLGRFLARWKLR